MILLENITFQSLDTWYWVAFAATAISALVSLGYSLAALRGRTGDAATFARYAASRSIAIVAGLVVALFVGSGALVFALAIVMTVVQGLDAIVGRLERDAMKTWGPAALALVTLTAAILLVAL